MSLKLRKIKEEDLQLIMKWRMSSEVTSYMYTNPKLTIESQQLWLKNISQIQDVLYWMIEFDHVPIGVINICDMDKVNKKCSWAYYIGDTSFRGKGIATLLECNIYDYVFYNLGLNKLCCEVFEQNDKVVKMHQKFGTEIEGLLKEHIIKGEEKYNVVTMGILKHKWDTTHENFCYDKIIIE
jgi:UDP-4-amino-4,6-dideoxy-N-acetyl-beta-L-altrosamine N-acetyltransferase